MIPRLQSAIQILPIDTASVSQKYLVKTEGERQFEISETLYRFTQLIDGKRTIEEIAEQFGRESGKECSPSDAERIIENYLVPHGIVAGEDGTGPSLKRKSYLYVAIPLFSQKLLRPITDVLKVLFAERFFYGALAFLAAFHIYFYGFAQKEAVSLASISGSDVILVYAAILLTTLFHELGHSSACHYFGASHGAIGLGLYLYMPVFYADVSDVWRLKRRERAVVDFGGMYFQLLTVPLFYVLYVVLKNPVFLLTIYALNFSLVTSLNPLLRFDGYWLASDLAGIPNLRKRAQAVLRSLVRKVLRRPGPAAPPALDLRPKTKYFLYGYAVVSNIFFAFFIYHIIIFLPDLFSTYPSALLEFFSSIPRELAVLNFSGILKRLSSILFPTLVVVMIGLMLYRLLSKLIQFRSRTVSRSLRHSSK